MLSLFWELNIDYASAQQESIQSEIESRQEELIRQKRVIEKLSQKERQVYSRLAKAEDRLDKIAQDIRSQEDKLQSILKKEAEIARTYDKISAEKSATQEKLSTLLQNIWPIFLESQSRSGLEAMEWMDLDRRMTWLKAIYNQAEDTYSLLQVQAGKQAANLARLHTIKDDYKASLNQINKSKDQLLSEKLAFLEELQEVRAQRLAGEDMISEIMDVIKSLNYQMQAVSERNFEALKGHLPWPADGKLVSSYNPSANPPHNGLSISIGNSSRVKAISWGKVVHNGTLRGFGRVVILFHGKDYYTLYAYLSDSNLQIGQEVEKGEAIGTAGYYPKLSTDGVYFELRFKQKAINPVPWLTES
ncbi:MAG: murein hydrolase activator EnvC [Desulfonatronovibrio sp.]